jgi:hypothetical protein
VRRKRRIVPLNQKVREVLILFGVYSLHKNWRYFDFYPNQRSENFVKFIRKISRNFNDTIYVILDNHRSHNSSFSKKELKKIGKIK